MYFSRSLNALTIGAIMSLCTAGPLLSRSPSTSLETAHTEFITGLTKRQSSVSCFAGKPPGYFPVGSAFAWNVYIPQPLGTTSTACGPDFLSSLRAQGPCGDISEWQCSPLDGGIAAAFITDIFCGTGQVQEAIWSVTSPQLQNQCFNNANADDIDGTEGFVAGLEGVFEGFGVALGGDK